MASTAATPIITSPVQSAKEGWYSDISELEGFENFEEENGILLGGQLSVGTYVNLNNRNEKVIILEEFRHQSNGEAQFRQLHQIKVILKKHQFISSDFCSSESFPDATIMALYEDPDVLTPTKNIIKAWTINQKTLQLESFSVRGVVCDLVN
jgi:hypothetical protein